MRYTANLTDEQIMRTTRLRKLTLASAVVAATWSPAMAAVMTIDFENIPRGTPSACTAVFGAPILDYYNGDKACEPPRQGTQDLNLSFAAGALAITTKSVDGGFGQFSSAKSGVSAAGTVADAAITVLLDGLLLSEFGFWFNATPGSDPVVELFSGSQSVFAQKLALCSTTGADGFCGWTQFTAPLASIGTRVSSIVFTAQPNSAVFDDMRFTTPTITPISEPSSVALALTGLAVVSALARRRRI